MRLRFGDSNDLPLTVSGAVARFPEDGESVTELLANAAVTLREARASGGDAVLLTGFEAGPIAQSHTFDVFQGLILAVDAKDRYTKRHSEDVARYAMFIGTRLGIPADELGTLRLAGLLHDVGKVGIPDQILRKPGKLTRSGVRRRQAARGPRRRDPARPARTSTRSAPASATTTSAGTGTATSTRSPARTSPSSRGSSPSRTRSRR